MIGQIFQANMCEMCRGSVGLFLWAIDNTLM